MINETLDSIFNRKSVRKYSEKTVADETLQLLIDAAMQAPSAVNRQPWEFVVIKDQEMKEKVAACNPYASFAKNASAIILVCGNMEKALPGPSQIMWVQDCSAASENLLIAAQSLGLGAVWTGVYPSPERMNALEELLNLPENILPLAMIPVGYPESEKSTHKKVNPVTVHYNVW